MEEWLAQACGGSRAGRAPSAIGSLGAVRVWSKNRFARRLTRLSRLPASSPARPASGPDRIQAAGPKSAGIPDPKPPKRGSGAARRPSHRQDRRGGRGCRGRAGGRRSDGTLRHRVPDGPGSACTAPAAGLGGRAPYRSPGSGRPGRRPILPPARRRRQQVSLYQK